MATSKASITTSISQASNSSAIGIPAATSLATGQVIERITPVATATTGVVNVDFLTSGVLYYTSNSTANWTFNVRGSSSVALNTALSANQSATVAMMVTQGASAYYANSFQIDGSVRTVKWQSGTAPTSGDANSINLYSYTIVKTAANTYTVLGSQSKYA